MTTAPLRPLARRAGPDTTHLYLTQRQTVLARGEDTGGAFALVEEVVRAGLEPPPHLHTREDEAFYVLEGEVDFQAGDLSHHAVPGDFVFLPRGLSHSFTLRTPTARLLVLLTPGGFERFFLALARPLTPEPGSPTPEDFRRLLARAPEHGIVWAARGPAEQEEGGPPAGDG